MTKGIACPDSPRATKGLEQCYQILAWLQCAQIEYEPFGQAFFSAKGLQPSGMEQVENDRAPRHEE